ncbi:Cu/Zn superoxide dismutase [Pelomonas saccharophila]|uniref:Superoxide dismutase [Cu-Zn] n=1 Tax=Roseateles saccharophilus TaxID=304 RepID=A0ABU1YG13_ROSSA|nr:superoxide dismutase [Cu-Zn] SodC [Roseateles saccharophilus]MDR7267796.1 Cu/Zn superoxide dismutase [Roseateles saccharophilus]
MKIFPMLSLALVAGLALPGTTHAADQTVTLYEARADGAGPSVGTIRVEETAYGLAFHPQLAGLPPGLHGFHFHENGSCAPSTAANGNVVLAGAAGGHFDPKAAKHHGEPWGDGHLGDLPPLYVNADGQATQPVLAPRLMKLSDIAGRALMLHVGGDNHADHPAMLGGGGARLACAVVGGAAPLQPEAGLDTLLRVHAVGQQIYECGKDAQGAWAWLFKGPQADLFDAAGLKVGTHGAGPSWALNDGSSLVGQVQATAPAPVPGAIPWLLLGVKARSGTGLLDKVSAIQRLATQGGVAPAKEGCTAATSGQAARVAYAAEYVFWAPGPAAAR